MGLNQDLDDIKAIEDKLTANKVAKFAYTDHAYNNPLTEADGVTYYNVDNEQNIPVADPSVLNVNDTVLTKGWRSQASSITRMLMNHFLGRVSYNLNKLNDNMSALLITLRTNLSDVVNTGDSANALSDGTTKFTTGGAYNLLTSIAPYFSSSIAYTVGQLVTYQNKLYECTASHSGAWHASHFTERTISAELALSLGFTTLTDANNRGYSGEVRRYYVDANTENVPDDLPSTFRGILEIFQQSNRAVTWQRLIVFYYGTGYAAAVRTFSRTSYWNGSEQNWGNWREEADKADITTLSDTKADLSDLAPSFSASTAYAVGDYVIYSRDLYRCTVAHSAGAWNASHFTVVTVGGELETKADKTSLALPTDAVLHYSFDEVPDYPDGTADVRLLDNNTYDIQSTDAEFRNNGGTTFTNNNGNLVVSITGGDGTGAGIASSSIYTKIVKVKIKVTQLTGELTIIKGNERYATITNIGKYELTKYIDTNNYLWFYCLGLGNSCSFTVEQIYIGDGSYSTPIIDNANGQNNAANNGILPVKGVSGKGAYLLKGKNATIDGTFQITKNFSISVWVKPDERSTTYGSIFNKKNVFSLINGRSWDSSLVLSLYGSNGALLDGQSIASIVENTLLHVVITREGTTLKVYKDGVLTNTFTLADSTIATNANACTVGSSVNTKSQMIDDLLIFDRALTDDEVMALYLNKANTPKYYGEVPVTRKINGHALSGNVTVTKGDVGLGNVSNTGDSAVPAENGTEKFTTGGAFDFFGKQTDAKKWLHYICAPLLGRNWRSITIDNVEGYRDLATDGEGHYVLTAGTGLKTAIYTSDDGVQFTASGAQIRALTLHYSSTWHKWFALGTIGLYTSTDRVTWSQVTSVTTGANTGARIVEGFSSSTLSNILYIAATHGLWYTTNGTSWTKVSVINDKEINALDCIGGFIWFASSTTGDVWRSTNGINWTSISGDIASSGTQIHKFVAYGTGFLACSNTGLWQSDNGATWTKNSTIGSVNVPSVDVNKNNCTVLTDTKIYFTNTDLAHLVDVFNRVDDNTFQQIACNGYMWIVESAKSSWYSLDGQHWLYASTHNNNVTDIYKLLYIDNNWYSLSNQSLLISDLQTA